VSELECEGRLVRPSAEVLRIAQDRILEKTFAREMGCDVAPFAAVTNSGELAAAIRTIGFPAFVKTARGGYDGKGSRSSATSRRRATRSPPRGAPR